MVIIGVLSNFNHFQQSCKFCHVRTIFGHFQNKQHILYHLKNAFLSRRHICFFFGTLHLFCPITHANVSTSHNSRHPDLPKSHDYSSSLVTTRGIQVPYHLPRPLQDQIVAAAHQEHRLRGWTTVVLSPSPTCVNARCSCCCRRAPHIHI